MTELTAERLWDIPRVGGPHALAEGLLAPVTTDDAANDESTTTLWRPDPDGSRRRFASGQIPGPAVSADGKAVAYLKEIEDHTQVHVQPVDGGEGRPVVDLPLGAAAGVGQGHRRPFGHLPRPEPLGPVPGQLHPLVRGVPGLAGALVVKPPPPHDPRVKLEVEVLRADSRVRRFCDSPS